MAVASAPRSKVISLRRHQAVGLRRPPVARAVPEPRVAVSFPPTRRSLPSIGRIQILMLAGAMPVSAIPLFVLGWLPMSDSAVFIVIPLALVALALMLRRYPEAVWAARGLCAGLGGVIAYDAVRMPLVFLGIWPDFIPRLGGWVAGSDENVLVGYAWRILGDGGGMGLTYFVFCSVVMAFRPALVTTHPILLSVGYGVFIWSGLLATVSLPRGDDLLFSLHPASFVLSLLGHLIYGSVLGVFLHRHVRSRA